MTAATLLLALAWMAATGGFSPVDLAVGLILGHLAVRLARPALPGARLARQLSRGGLFLVRYTLELLRSSWRVARVVLSPRLDLSPGMVELPLEARTELEITIVANLISLTPGTLSVDLSPDGGTLYVHALFVDPSDVDATRRQIREAVERPVLEVLRTG
jgi:multicomponent Na+:H+ antiporter subunit E